MSLKRYRDKIKARNPDAVREVERDLAFKTSLCLTDIRLMFGLTQEKLAQRTGIFQPSIARAEKNGCSISFLQKVCDALDVVIDIRVKREPERSRDSAQ